ncbi:universal stress protein [uncultured Arenimonas sp.]|uniref:universal stress protein n=1 Tax=uncultured Arenimonas sp. TaxID=546226 RepID=UPI0030DBBF26
MIRDLFVFLQGTPADAAALDAAIALAQAHDAHVAALAVAHAPVPFASEWGVTAVGLDQAGFEALRKAAEDAAAGARKRLEAAGVAHEVRVADSPLAWPEEVAALHARHADLCVFGGPAPDAPGSRFGTSFDALLMHSGRPVLLVPDGVKLMVPPRRVVIAWQPRREASRAVHDALPWLPRDARVDVLVVNPQSTALGYGEAPGSDIARHLARHGCQAKVVEVERGSHSTGQAILEHARESIADLVVMGGFSHSRWREQVFGGVTRTVLEGTRTPVLFSH